MPFPLRLCTFAGLAVVTLSGLPVPASARDAATLEEAVEVLDALVAVPLKGIPPALLRDAQGVAIFPGVFKAGFIIGGRHGQGVILARGPDGAWGRPEFLSLTGGSIGWQVGVQSTDLVLVFRTQAGLERLRKRKLTLGADAAVAAGPVGRALEAGTDGRLRAEILSYSRSRGLFAGVSLAGAALTYEPGRTEAYYRQEAAAVRDPQAGAVVPVTPPSVKLQMKVAQLTTAAPAVLAPPVPSPAPLQQPPAAPPR